MFQFDIPIENGPFTVDLPLQSGDFPQLCGRLPEGNSSDPTEKTHGKIPMTNSQP